jgi:hypothetical protein
MIKTKHIGIYRKSIVDGQTLLTVEFPEIQEFEFSATNMEDLEDISMRYLRDLEDFEDGTFEVELVPAEINGK